MKFFQLAPLRQKLQRILWPWGRARARAAQLPSHPRNLFDLWTEFWCRVDCLRSGHAVICALSERQAPLIRPYALADQYMLPRADVLSACLLAAECGMVRAHWVLVCPRCEVAAAQVLSPSLKSRTPCSVCQAPIFNPNGEQAELIFALPSLQGRKAPPPITQQLHTRIPKCSFAILHAPAQPGLYGVFGGAQKVANLAVEEMPRAGVRLIKKGGCKNILTSPGGRLVIFGNAQHSTCVVISLTCEARQGVPYADVAFLPRYIGLKASCFAQSAAAPSTCAAH